MQYVKNIIKRNRIIQTIIALAFRALYNTYFLGGGKKHIQGKNNKIRYNNSFVRKLNITIIGCKNTIIIGDCSRLINCKIVIWGNNNKIDIGSYANFNKARFWLDEDNNSITIGSQTSIRGNTLLGAIEGTNIHIGSDCMFSEDIDIRTGDSHSIVNLNGKRTNHSVDINISSHVWIARNVTILKGVSIPRDCIIGACSLVTKGVFINNSIICGNPSYTLKTNINWDRKRIKKFE